MPVKLIIFDLDGTLVDSSVDITNALNYAIEPYGLKPLTVPDTIKMVGEGITRLVEKMLGDDASSIKDPVMERFLEHYTQHIIDYTTTYPGVKETLERLNGYKKAVISNKRENLSRMVLSGLGLAGFFEYIVGSDTTPEKKPSPMPVLRVLSEMDVPASETIMVGDSHFDIDAGRAAGVTTIAVTYGYRPKEMLGHADYQIDLLADLIPLIEKINASDNP